MLPVEGAARDEVWEFDLPGIGGVDSGVFCEAQPNVKISREREPRRVHPHDFIQENTGVDNLLEARILSRASFKHSAGFDLALMRSRCRNDLNRRGLKLSLD